MIRCVGKTAFSRCDQAWLNLPVMDGGEGGLSERLWIPLNPRKAPPPLSRTKHKLEQMVAQEVAGGQDWFSIPFL